MMLAWLSSVMGIVIMMLDDMNRQRILERARWKFWRCFASTFVMNRKHVIQDLISTLTSHGVGAIGFDGVISSIHCEQRRIKV
jgi:hypothetical protein